MSPDILLFFEKDERIRVLNSLLKKSPPGSVFLENLSGSSSSFVSASIIRQSSFNHLIILNDNEEALYHLNDLENLLQNRKVLFYPPDFLRSTASVKSAITGDGYKNEDSKNAELLKRTVTLDAIRNSTNNVIVTVSSALCEKVVSRDALAKNIVDITSGEKLSMEFMVELLSAYHFNRADFVTDPGQYSRRGGILDIFSYSAEHPCRIEFSGDTIESIRSFDASTQLSLATHEKVAITPDINDEMFKDSCESFLNFLGKNGTIIWIKDYPVALRQIEDINTKLHMEYGKDEKLLIDKNEFEKQCGEFQLVTWGVNVDKNIQRIRFNTTPQVSFGKNFNLFFDELNSTSKRGYNNFIFTDTEQQMKRLHAIVEDIQNKAGYEFKLDKALIPVFLPIHEGFKSEDMKLACYTDHEIFGRYHRFRLEDSYYKAKEAITLQELFELKPGDYVTHIDHGIGRFAGLEKVEVNGNMQEVVRILYKDNDLLYVSIHSLHRISKYSGKEGHAPVLDKLGSANWKNLKRKTKGRIKTLAFDLVKLYAQRKHADGFAYSPDTYLQNELEASFIYEDTPDQVKATEDVKRDMESPHPMDRLICGDVGFGKTEIAIRAAFKAVTDGKQVALLCPTTILAFQHFKTFSDRLKDFPCTIDYLSRFRSQGERRAIEKRLADGKIDIIIGTHQLVNKNVHFKDLGLLIVDEEQKFGVGVKDKLKNMRLNVDILTLTATPIPRTLQFSMIGIRDISVINTAPPNRYPIHTEIIPFNEHILADAINYEIARGGQAFFIQNRIQNLVSIAEIIRTICKNLKIEVAHGQLKGHQLEEIMMRFVEGQTDVLVSTAIVESGLDIPNLNTIFINDAHNFGLSDLHQLRGRVGRSNKKAFCYLIIPPYETLTKDAQKRLDAIEKFSGLGSGFKIALRDLDLRGAGNLFGGEQSGFINEMGIDMYYKILSEAIEELKEELSEESETAEQKAQSPHKKYVSDCTMETDKEAWIPDDFISNAEERLRLYRELNEANNEEGIERFNKELTDRFGKPPKQVSDLLDVIRIRLMAINLGIERIVFKNNMLTCFFISEPDSLFYSSKHFSAIMDYIKDHPENFRLRQQNNRLSLTVSGVIDIGNALGIMKGI